METQLKITPKRKKDIQRRYENAEPGHWMESSNDDNYPNTDVVTDAIAVAMFYRPDDANFAAAAHQDVPDLLEDLEALERENQWLKEENFTLDEVLRYKTKMLEDLGKGELSGLTLQQVTDLDGYANSQRVRADHLEMQANHLKAENNRLREKLRTASSAMRSTTDPVCECGKPHSAHILYDDGIRRYYEMDRAGNIIHTCEGFKRLEIEDN